MKKILIIMTLCLSVIKIVAQSYEQIYTQQEQARINNLNTTETDIENFITQNINTYDFTDIINQVNNIKNEQGQPIADSDYQKILLSKKKDKLRENYFQNYPEKIQYYYSNLAAQCVNGGFEDNGGSSNGYSFYSQKFIDGAWHPFNNFPASTTGFQATSGTTMATIVDTSSTDPITYGQRTHTGRFAIRLNNFDADYDVTRMTRQFVVTENSISFAYSLVLQDGHNNGRNAYYQVNLRNSSNVVVYHRDVMADYTNTSLFTSIGSPGNRILYTGWQCEKIQTWQYMGQTMTLEIVLADCGDSGHFGYGYFDDFCGFDCVRSSFDGTISLNPLKVEKCPTYPIPVSGNFTLPLSGGSLTGPGNGIFLDILDATTGSVLTTISNPTITGGNFVFNLSNYDFYNGFINSILKYNFRVRMNYSTSTSSGLVLQATNTNPPGPDLSFEGCTTPCFEEIIFTHNNPIITSQNFQAACCITSESYINPNLSVDFKAGYIINLKPGFYTTSYNSGNFHAYIEPCAENSSIIPQQPSSRLAGKNIALPIENTEVKVYPNPATNYMNISLGNEKLVSWEIFDLSGKSILKGNSVQIDLKNIINGSYLLKINLEKRQVSKIVIVK